MASKPKTCAIIVNFNHSDLTIKAIDSLAGSCDVVVIDNSTDLEAQAQIQVAAKELRVELINRPTNPGYSVSVNAGLDYALGEQYEYLFILNPDTIASPALIDRLERDCEENPDIKVISPVILYPDRKIWFAGTTLNLYFGRAEHKLHKHSLSQLPEQHLFTSPTLTGCAIFLRREAALKVGPMPAEYFLYYEDADWTLHLSRLGYNLYVDSDAYLIHHVSASGTGGLAQQYYMYRNRIIFVRKYGNWAQRTFIWLGGILDMLYTLKPVSPHRFKLLLVALSGEIDAARHKTGKRPTKL